MQLTAVRADAEAARTLRQYYRTLLARLGPQGWWPARTRLEVILGAILVQNTSWNNAARAIKRLREGGLLKLAPLRKVSPASLEEFIRPAGFYRQKAAAIRGFLEFLERVAHGSLTRLFSLPAEKVRRELLRVRGFGPETVDAILLYAGRKPFFVADTYTRRILTRHSLLHETAGYAEAQEFLHRHLLGDASLFNEFHALLVEVGKRFCRRAEANCYACPLREFLPVATDKKADSDRASEPASALTAQGG
ncbi:MAG: endonuclease III domain-containing protein [Terriglobia bacterium]